MVGVGISGVSVGISTVGASGVSTGSSSVSVGASGVVLLTEENIAILVNEAGTINCPLDKERPGLKSASDNVNDQNDDPTSRSSAWTVPAGEML